MTMDLDEDEKKALAANLAWLGSAGPEDWHRVALDFNWDAPLHVLDWIVRQADCDIATALTIFWLGEPACWLVEEGASDEEPNGFSWLNAKICAYIANRVREGGYARSGIAFAPDTWTKQRYVELVAAEQSMERPNFRSHPDLIRDRRGRAVELNDDFYRRYPREFHHSAFSEQFSDDIERGAYETPESLALMKKVDEIEQEALRRLPGWLRPELDLPELQSEASSLVYGTIFVGILLSALFTGALSRFGAVLGWVVGSCLVAYGAYGVFTSVREIQRLLRSCGSAMSTRWLAGSLASSLALGGGISYVVLGHVGAWREAYGAVPVNLVGLTIVVPALYLASRLLAGFLVRSRSIRSDG